MKRLVFVFVLLGWLGLGTAARADENSLQDSVTRLIEKTTKLEQEIKALMATVAVKQDSVAKPEFAGHSPLKPREFGKGMRTFYSLLPVLLLVALFMWLRRKIDWQKVLNEALKEKVVSGKPVSFAREEGEPDPPASSSRIVMMFSGFAAIILAASFSCVYIYGYMSCTDVPDFSTLVNVLLSLGIGVVPYTVRQITGK